VGVYVADKGVVIVVCPTCGARRSVSQRQARRCSDGQGVCRACSRGRQVRDESDKALAWWFARLTMLTCSCSRGHARTGGSGARSRACRSTGAASGCQSRVRSTGRERA
jgi:hypothetical protein